MSQMKRQLSPNDELRSVSTAGLGKQGLLRMNYQTEEFRDQI